MLASLRMTQGLLQAVGYPARLAIGNAVAVGRGACGEHEKNKEISHDPDLWFPLMDSNHDSRLQRAVSYH